MSGGINAIKGFDYQATVILDRLFDHFDRHGQAARARPEGLDDLDLSWKADGVERRRYEQIKKPREDNDGNLNPTPWTLSRVIEELLPNTIAHLSGNAFTQVWIVGDRIDNEVSSLLDAGERGPIDHAGPYWSTVHGLARDYVISAVNLQRSVRQKLRRWSVPDLPAHPEEALPAIVAAFCDFAEKLGATDVTAQYGLKAKELHDCLPGVLARTEILPAYGAEQEVARRVYARLEQRYQLQRSVIENTVFRNLRGFINDVSKQPGRKVDREELEDELRCVWPQMIPIKDPPLLDSDHVARPDLAERLTTRWTGKAVEIVGISGSGKTTLAAEVEELTRNVDPDRLVYYAEVRADVGLRDVLVGVAFHLRRLGIRDPFSVSVESGAANELALPALRARSRLFRGTSCFWWTSSTGHAPPLSLATSPPLSVRCRLPPAGSRCSGKKALCGNSARLSDTNMA
jgi:hypothetical protein